MRSNTLIRICIGLLAGCLSSSGGNAASEEPAMSLTLTSTAFAHQSSIPARYTCDSQDISPPLSWHGVPAKAHSLVLIVDDPDAPDPAAPRMTWVHWLLYNLPAIDSVLAENASAADLPAGTRIGVNDWQRSDYGGPCPPVGRHRYFHKLYALDIVLPDLGKPDKARLEQAMQNHILAHAELIGTYQRAR